MSGAGVAARVGDRPSLALTWRPTPLAILGVGIGIVAGGAAFAGVWWWASNGFIAGDTLTYWLAAQRVLVGHELYAVRLDDPWLFDIRPYGLYSPPLVVVPWLGLASMAGTSGMIVWWVAMASLAFWAVAAVLIGSRGWAGIAILPLVPSLTLLIGVGNVDAVVLAGIVAAWLLRDRARALGAIVGFLVSLKVTPLVLVVWLIATRRWRALAAAAVTALAIAALVAVVLGPGIFGDYAQVVAGATATPVAWPRVVAVALLAAVLALGFVAGRRGERAAFALSIATIPFGSPVTAVHTWALLVGCLAPLIRRPSA